MKRLGLAASLCLLLVNPALAQDPSQQAADPEQLPAAAANAGATEAQPLTDEQVARSQEMVCRTQRMTGSLTRRTRVCATRAEWEDNARRTNQEISRITGGANGSPVCRPGDESGC